MNETELQSAISRSISHNEIVHCEWDGGDAAALVTELSAIYEGDVDSVRENDGTIDVWGCPDDGVGDMDWRLRVTLTA